MQFPQSLSRNQLPLFDAFLASTIAVVEEPASQEDLSLIHISEPTRPY